LTAWQPSFECSSRKTEVPSVGRPAFKGLNSDANLPKMHVKHCAPASCGESKRYRPTRYGEITVLDPTRGQEIGPASLYIRIEKPAKRRDLESQSIPTLRTSLAKHWSPSPSAIRLKVSDMTWKKIDYVWLGKKSIILPERAFKISSRRAASAQGQMPSILNLS
jgi:hypothetical protein